MVYYFKIHPVSMVGIHHHGWREENEASRLEEGRPSSRRKRRS
jgi:hypothetical protein